MGRIKTTLIKRITNQLILEHKDKFKKNFEENKEIVNDLLEIKSKKIRNIIAGYITRLMKAEKQ